MKQMVAAGAGLMLSGGFAQAAGLGRQAARAGAGKRVVVIGAGFAGLACAFELSSVGYDVTVVEARNKVGGRVLSFNNSERSSGTTVIEGKNIEGGAELIGSNHPTWMAYAEKFGLEFLDVSEDEEADFIITVGGRRISGEESAALYEEMTAAFETMNADARNVNPEEPWTARRAEEWDAMSLKNWTDRLEASELCKKAIEAQFGHDNAVDDERASYLGMLAQVSGGGVEKYWTDSEVYRCKGGNQQLAFALAERVGEGRVVTGLPCRSIEVRGSGVVVTCGDGRTIEADYCVLAVPPSVWGRIEVKPALPLDLKPQMGSAVKFLSVVKSRFWEAQKLSQFSLSAGDVGWTWDGTDGQRGEDPANDPAMLTVFSGGDASERLRAMDPQTRVRRIAELLEQIYPGYNEQAMATKFMDWPGDRWAACGYSFPAPGQVTTVGPRLQQPHADRVYLAGEHTCYRFVGYMEGALYSGSSVARKIALRDAARAPVPAGSR